MNLLVSDTLWQRVEPLLPPPPKRRFRFPGRKPLDYRKILTGILFVLKTGIAWDDLPAELGCGCGKTCRHFMDRAPPQQYARGRGSWQQAAGFLFRRRIRPEAIALLPPPHDFGQDGDNP